MRSRKKVTMKKMVIIAAPPVKSVLTAAVIRPEERKS